MPAVAGRQLQNRADFVMASMETKPVGKSARAIRFTRCLPEALSYFTKYDNWETPRSFTSRRKEEFAFWRGCANFAAQLLKI
jgi:hypothetical protein